MTKTTATLLILILTVNDRGGRIGNRNIDLVVETKADALSFGRQQRKAVVF